MTRAGLSVCSIAIAAWLSMAFSGAAQTISGIKIVFYNTENLFDPSDDPKANDNDFTPAGAMHWTYKRFTAKENNLGKVLIAIGEWNPPDIIGLCEIENDYVLDHLVAKTSLSKFGYSWLHRDSPDKRGIDVALLYNPSTVKVLECRYFRIDTNIVVSREILYACLLAQSDTFHVFVNHWPSRSAGQLETDKSRFAAASLLRQKADSLFNHDTASNIVIMGDFNDEPTDESLVRVLNAGTPEHPVTKGLYNLSRIPEKGPVKGTLKFQGTWNIFDQIMVSGNLLLSGRITSNSYHIFDGSFLLEPDETYTGMKPYRTYSGFRYHGGFSDHLPVYVVISDW
ncbi:MAG TPA: endonuclease/exonuclease/phosphatase family protein [Bacteroidales bacterium]|nr:endonuclease/exonuclease/phosphatase family protein [Bacteroidales bacterium]